MRISLASDHTGYHLKIFLKKSLEEEGVSIIDEGCDSPDSCDYPDYAKKTCESIIEDRANFGILICGSGLGMSICANRFSGIRAALCHNEFTAQKAREHNDANIIVIGAKIINNTQALKIVRLFLKAHFEGGRHLRRLEKIS